MRCAIHQPQFLPWLGHFQKIAMCDVFVFLDNVQFQKNEFQNRNRIPTQQGPKWLTVPVSYDFGDPIQTVRIGSDTPWRRKILGTVTQAYLKTPHFGVWFPGFEALLQGAYEGLSAINRASVLWLMACFQIRTPVILASTLPACQDDRTGRLVDICRLVGATTYVSGSLAQRYLDLAQFSNAGIEVAFQHYNHPVYPQTHGGEFLPYMSAIDGLFCAGGGAEGRRRLNLDPADASAGAGTQTAGEQAG